MARIRTIKPEFFTSEDIVEMPPLARLFYIALWCEADKEGRFVWKPKTFKMRYLPGDDCDIDAICDALVSRGLIVMYGDDLAFIPRFKDHQHINPREKPTVLPPPPDECTTRQPRVSDGESTCREEGRKEGKDKDAKKKPPATPSFDPRFELENMGVNTQTANDWLALRKSLKAVVTKTALDQIVKEAAKANIPLEAVLAISCKRGWRGFEASWLRKEDLLGSVEPLKKDWI